MAIQTSLCMNSISLQRLRLTVRRPWENVVVHLAVFVGTPVSFLHVVGTEA